MIQDGVDYKTQWRKLLKSDIDETDVEMLRYNFSKLYFFLCSYFCLIQYRIERTLNQCFLQGNCISLSHGNCKIMREITKVRGNKS